MSDRAKGHLQNFAQMTASLILNLTPSYCVVQAPDTRAGGGAPEMESQLSTLATCGFGVEPHWRPQPAKLPSFGGYSLETLPYQVIVLSRAALPLSTEATLLLSKLNKRVRYLPMHWEPQHMC